MDISRKSALKTIGTALGATSLFGLGAAKAEAYNSSMPDNLNQRTIYDVRNYGAVGDGRADDTDAINKAITAAAKNGGGKVILPAGTYRSGSVHLKSNITLHFSEGAVLEATDDSASYDDAEPFDGPQYQDFGHSHWHNSLIWGENIENVAITGPGMIYGKGLLRSETHNQSQKGRGNKSIALKRCRNVRLSGFTVKHGGWFCLLATGVDNMRIDNLLIDTNRDGLDLDGGKNIHVSNCTINSPHDDAIVPKSSYALGELNPVQNLTITNCVVSGYKEGTVLDGSFQPLSAEKYSHGATGRIKLGTESNGDFKNITISNCTFDHCRGLALESVDGSRLEDISISNITMRNVTNAPIFMRLGRRMRGPKGASVGHLRRINISNVVVHNADNKTGVLLTGIPGHNIEDVKLNNIRIVYEGGGTSEQAKINPPENEDGYPEPFRFGRMPSYGMYIRHVNDIEISNVKLSYLEEDVRPPFVLNDVSDADFRFVKAEHASDVPIFSFKKVKNVRTFEVEGVPNKTFTK